MTIHPRARRIVTGEYACPDCGCCWAVGDEPTSCKSVPTQLRREKSRQAYLSEMPKIRALLKKDSPHY